MNDAPERLPRLEFRLLGTPEMHRQGHPFDGPTLAKSRGLVYYLALTGRAHSRVALAGLLWGDQPEEMARVNLRKALAELSATLGDYLAIERYTIGFRSSDLYRVDAVEFVAQVNAAHAQADANAVAPLLQAAVALYRDDFLAGFYVRNAPDFELWMLAERARLRETMLQALARLAAHAADRGDLDQAITFARRQLQMEPWREETHRQLMAWLAYRGQRSAALAQYELCRRALAEELDVEPDRATQDLYQRLLRQELSEASEPEAPFAPEYVLVGRKQEWQTLAAAWHKSLRGAAHLITLAGEPGIGKTRLAEELLAHAQRQGHVALRTRAFALEGRLAYAPVADWLRAEPLQARLTQLADVWLAELARLLPELLHSHPHLPPPQPLTERWQQKRFFEALAQPFTAARLPLLLVLDDVQWCDPETLEWLYYLLTVTPRAKLLVVGTLRPEEADDDHPLHRLGSKLLAAGQLTTLDLTPLDAEETAQLAAQAARQALPADAAARLYRETAGNPLFVIESVRAGTEQISVDTDVFVDLSLPGGEHGEASHRLPPKVRAVIRERLLRLSPQARELAQLAAVIGRTFTTDLLARAADQDEASVLVGLDELWRRRIVCEVSPTRYDFSHDRIRDGAYLETGPLQRRLLHHRVAQALQTLHAGDTTAVAGELGVHFERAGLLAEASDYYRQAGESAQQLYAHREAVNYYTRAINVLHRLPEQSDLARRKIELWLELGLVQILIAGWGSEPVGHAWQQAYNLAMQAGTTFQKCRAIMGLDIYHRNRGEWRTARMLAETNVALIEHEVDGYLRQCVLTNMAAALYHLGDPAQALRYHEQVICLARVESTPSFPWISTETLTNALFRSGKCLWLLGYPDQARTRCDEATRIGYRLAGIFTVSSVLDFSAMVHSFCRDAQTVHRLGNELLEFATQYEFPFYIRAGNMYIGWAMAHQGEPATGAAMIRASVEGHRRDGTRMFEPYWRGLLAEALALAGQPAEALAEVEAALAYAEESGNCYWSAHLLKLKADYLHTLASPTARIEQESGQESEKEVEQVYERAIATAQQQNARSLELRATLGLCRIWQRQAKRAQAHDRLAPLYASFTEGFDTADLQEASTLLAELRDTNPDAPPSAGRVAPS